MAAIGIWAMTALFWCHCGTNDKQLRQMWFYRVRRARARFVGLDSESQKTHTQKPSVFLLSHEQGNKPVPATENSD